MEPIATADRCSMDGGALHQITRDFFCPGFSANGLAVLVSIHAGFDVKVAAVRRHGGGQLHSDLRTTGTAEFHGSEVDGFRGKWIIVHDRQCSLQVRSVLPASFVVAEAPALHVSRYIHGAVSVVAADFDMRRG